MNQERFQRRHAREEEQKEGLGYEATAQREKSKETPSES
jgi:hypothetical protein